MTAMRRVLVVAALLTVLGCATKPAVMLPPRIDLKEHELIGILRFDSTAEGELAATLSGQDVLTSPLLPGFACPLPRIWAPAV